MQLVVIWLVAMLLVVVWLASHSSTSSHIARSSVACSHTAHSRLTILTKLPLKLVVVVNVNKNVLTKATQRHDKTVTTAS